MRFRLVCAIAARLPSSIERDRQHDQHLLPVDRDAEHALDQQAHRDREGGELRRAADQQRHRRRRALVDVGHPHVERHGAELEGEPGDDEDDAEDQHRAVDLAGADRLEDLADLERAGRAVDHRHAVEQEAAAPARRARSTSSPPRSRRRRRGAARPARRATATSARGRGRRPGSCWPRASPGCRAARTCDSVNSSPLSMSRARGVGPRVDERHHHRQRSRTGRAGGPSGRRRPCRCIA